MTWYQFVGYSLFWVGLIVSVILYAIKRKWHPIMYMISVALYVFLVCFIIDVYQLKKNGILLILSISALIMLGLGYYLNKKFSKVSKR